MSESKTLQRLAWAAFEGICGETVKLAGEARIRRRAFEAGLEVGLQRGYMLAREDLRLRADLWASERSGWVAEATVVAAALIDDVFEADAEEPIEAEVVGDDG